MTFSIFNNHGMNQWHYAIHLGIGLGLGSLATHWLHTSVHHTLPNAQHSTVLSSAFNADDKTEPHTDSPTHNTVKNTFAPTPSSHQAQASEPSLATHLFNSGKTPSKMQWLQLVNQLTNAPFDEQLAFLMKPPHTNRELAHAQHWMAGYLGEQFPEKALDIMAALPEKNQEGLLSSFIGGWSSSDPEAVWQWLNTGALQEGFPTLANERGYEKHLKNRCLSRMAEKPELLDNAIQIAMEQSEASGLQSQPYLHPMYSIAHAVAEQNPDKALELATGSDATNAFFLGAAFRQYTSDNPQQAAHIIQNFPNELSAFSGEVNSFMNEVYQRQPEQFYELVTHLPNDAAKVDVYSTVIWGERQKPDNQRTLAIIASVSDNPPLQQKLVSTAVSSAQLMDSFQDVSDLFQQLESTMDWSEHGETIGFNLKRWLAKEPDAVARYMDQHFPKSNPRYQSVWEGFNEDVSTLDSWSGF